MKKLLSFRSRVGPKLASMLALTLVCGTSAFATPLGTDITYYDNDPNPANSNGNAWYDGDADTRPGIREDQETEPGTVTTQTWDLEGVFIGAGDILSIVGQFPFATGIAGGSGSGTNGIFDSGDIFLSVNPNLADVQNPNGDGTGYQYVIDITSTNTADSGLAATYTIYNVTGLTTSTGLIGVTGGPDTGPNPYRYGSGGTAVAGGTGAILLTSYNGNGGPDDPDFQGTTPHYVLSGFDLTVLGLSNSDNLYVHYTMQCGNDLLTGYMTGYNPPPPPVPEPATMLIMGLGLASAALGKRSVKRLIS
ncbi:MAG: PEP-CTERM sorting domain-containing protein [Candidatus Hydrogenedentes bacterium]|nr:PEP-CTERM sorting domain-containing protein [Candidatus Hydrogenedentota bacterium]